VIQVFRAVRPPDIKALAESWYKPQLEERPKAFHRAVQGKLGEFSARGTVRSPVAYYAVETLAQQEVEQYGQIFLTGYKQAFAAVSTPISSGMLAQVKRDLDALLSSEAERSLKAIQHVREFCGITAATKDAAELRRLPQQKLVAELDLFVAQLNSERQGSFFKEHPVLALVLAFASFLFGWLPQWGASVWSLFSSQPLVPYLIEQTTRFNWNLVTMPIGFGGCILLIWLLVRSRVQSASAADTGEGN
jgi:hypothetical protein